MHIKRKYKGVKGEGDNLYECLVDEDEKGRNSSSHFAKYVDGDIDYYCSEEHDAERIHDILWDNFNLEELNWFEKNGFDVDKIDYGSSVDRKDIKDLLSKFKEETEEYKRVKKFQDLFMKDLNGKRCSWAEERAWENLNDELNHYGKDGSDKYDQDLADMFGIELEITDWGICGDGDYVPASEVIGFSDCQSAVVKDELFAFNGKIEEKEESDHVGFCSMCGNKIYLSQITDEETRVLLNI